MRLIFHLILCGSDLVGEAAESRDIDSTAGFLDFRHFEHLENDEDNDNYNGDGDGDGDGDGNCVDGGDGDGDL